jgi:hypothetical protein
MTIQNNILKYIVLLRDSFLIRSFLFYFIQCPQCGRKYKQNSIINIYVLEIAIPNDDLEKVSFTSLTWWYFWPSTDACFIYVASVVIEREKWISGAHINITSAMSCIFVFSKLMPFCISMQKRKLLEEIKEHKVLAQLKLCFSNTIISSVVHVYSCIFPYLTCRGKLFCSKI